ncbi:MAG: ribonuclease III [Chloroflexota bacterium]
MIAARIRELVPEPLLRQALTHPSYAYEHVDEGDSNQRLEFLGDSVVNLAVAELLYELHPDWPEGELTKTRAALVCEASLAQAAVEAGLGEELLLGRGEERTGGRTRPSNLADAFEALIGAVYRTAGFAAAAALVREWLPANPVGLSEGRDWKSELQEITQRVGLGAPTYAVVGESGPDHDKLFIVEARCGNMVGRGQGKSKKEAEQEAARQVVQTLTTAQSS